MRQLSGHDRGGGRWGTAAGGKNVCPRPVQTPGVPTGAAGDGSGRGGSRGDMTSSSPAGGGSYVSTESQRLARVSPGGGVDAEVRPIAVVTFPLPYKFSVGIVVLGCTQILAILVRSSFMLHIKLSLKKFKSANSLGGS